MEMMMNPMTMTTARDVQYAADGAIVVAWTEATMTTETMMETMPPKADMAMVAVVEMAVDQAIDYAVDTLIDAYTAVRAWKTGAVLAWTHLQEAYEKMLAQEDEEGVKEDVEYQHEQVLLLNDYGDASDTDDTDDSDSSADTDDEAAGDAAQPRAKTRARAQNFVAKNKRISPKIDCKMASSRFLMYAAQETDVGSTSYQARVQDSLEIRRRLQDAAAAAKKMCGWR